MRGDVSKIAEENDDNFKKRLMYAYRISLRVWSNECVFFKFSKRFVFKYSIMYCDADV